MVPGGGLVRCLMMNVEWGCYTDTVNLFGYLKKVYNRLQKLNNLKNVFSIFILIFSNFYLLKNMFMEDSFSRVLHVYYQHKLLLREVE